jgi:hypothetical protein
MPRLSLGTGIGWDGMAEWVQATWSAVSIPLIVGVDVTRWNRSTLRIGREGAGRLDPSTSTYGWHAAPTFGCGTGAMASRVHPAGALGRGVQRRLLSGRHAHRHCVGSAW